VHILLLVWVMVELVWFLEGVSKREGGRLTLAVVGCGDLDK
jgi:hypothetical protein